MDIWHLLWDRGEYYMEEKQFRDKVYWLTFLFSLLVVWVHSFNGELFMGTPEAAFKVAGIERILGDRLGQIAVPGFFMVSSYLFFRGFCWEKLIPKWRSRLRSLVLPYLLWNFLYYMGYVAATRLPGLSGVVGKTPIPFNGPRLFDALVFYSYNPVFWYLFQLIILVALAPLVYTVMRGNVTGAAALGIMAFGLWKNWAMPLLNLDALFYFCAAAWVSLHRDTWGRGIEERSGAGKNMAAGAILLLAMGLLLYLGRIGGLLWERPLCIVCWRLWGVCGAVLAVKAADLPAAREWMKHNFFLYAIHFSGVRLINKAAAAAFQGSAVIALAVFILMPVLMTAVSAMIGGIMRRFVPNVYYMLSGGR